MRFAVEDLGASPLAERFGVDKYPALFVDDALVARPEDFYGWGTEVKGKYMPWTDLSKRRQYQSDLARMIDIRLAGGNVPSLAVPKAAEAEHHLPTLDLVDLDGKTFAFAGLRGKPVVIEFWATWCPYCLQTLDWLKGLDPAAVSVVAVAVDSGRKDIDALVTARRPRGRIAIASPALREAFNGPPAIPLLIVADADGKIIKTYFGAPAGLHESVLRDLKALR